MWLVSSLNWPPSLLMSLSVYSEGTSDCKDVSGPEWGGDQCGKSHLGTGRHLCLCLSLSVYSEGTSDCKDVSGPKWGGDQCGKSDL